MQIANTLFGLGTTKSGRETLFGQGPKTKQLPTMTKEQQGLLSQLMQMLGGQGGLGQGQQESTDLLRQYLDPSSEAVSQFTQPYMDEFNQQTIPRLAEQYAGLGGGLGGGLSSSGFGQALGAAGSNLQTNLAALRAGLGQQAAQSLMNQYSGLSGQALGARPFGYTHEQGTQGLLPQFLSAYAQGGFPGMSNMFSSNGNGFQGMFK